MRMYLQDHVRPGVTLHGHNSIIIVHPISITCYMGSSDHEWGIRSFLCIAAIWTIKQGVWLFPCGRFNQGTSLTTKGKCAQPVLLVIRAYTGRADNVERHDLKMEYLEFLKDPVFEISRKGTFRANFYFIRCIYHSLQITTKSLSTSVARYFLSVQSHWTELLCSKVSIVIS